MVGVLGEKERDIFLRCQFPYGIGFGPGICGAVEGDASGKWEGKGLCKRREQDAFYSPMPGKTTANFGAFLSAPAV